MKYIIFLLLSIVLLQVNGQKEDYQWFIDIDQGGDAVIQGLSFDWNNKNSNPKLVILPFGIGANNAPICDKEGNLLFWSNGCAVINRNQEVMPHGDTLNWDEYRTIVWKDYIHGYPGAQNIKFLQIVPYYSSSR